ncbi:MAG: hypothetical protein Q7R96_00745 [Nanoarchaeota archaeon]|nr:hypothetical protein [Nanoarchaeota archaeon]
MLAYKTWKEEFEHHIEEIRQRLEMTHGDSFISSTRTTYTDCLDTHRYQGTGTIRLRTLPKNITKTCRKAHLGILADTLEHALGKTIAIITETQIGTTTERSINVHENYRRPITRWNNKTQYATKTKVFTT